jgi:hypothetical protein
MAQRRDRNAGRKRGARLSSGFGAAAVMALGVWVPVVARGDEAKPCQRDLSAQAEEDRCATPGADLPVQVMCAAYREGIHQLWATERDARKRKAAIDADMKNRADWVNSPAHVEHPSSDKYVLFFNADGTPVAPVPEIDEDDRVAIVILSPHNDLTEVRVTACGSAAPARIGGSGKSPVSLTGEHEPPDVSNRYRVVLASRCSSDTGIAAVVSVAGDSSSHDVKISTLSLYRFTVGVGLIFDFARDIEFRAVPVKGSAVPILVKDEHLRGLAPPVVFVSWRPFAVDMMRSRWPRVHEWLGVSLGVSLAAPLDHVYLGLLLEPYPGIGVTGGAHFQTVESLAGGYQVGDRFSGGGRVPVDRRWMLNETSGFVGLSLDSSVLTRLLRVVQ